MSKTTKPPPARAVIFGRADLSDFDARARPVDELLADIDRLTAEQEGEILDAARRNGTDPTAVYKRWNSHKTAARGPRGHGGKGR